MSQRLDYMQQSPEMVRKLMELSAMYKKSTLGNAINDLVNIRASQLNGCAFCVDMHHKEAKLHGERELRLYHIAVWRESNLFEPRERAALAWTEALTQIPADGIPNELYEEVSTHFPEKELSDLTFQIMVINAWNRANVAFLPTPGSFDKAWGLDKAGLS
jgi:AhpD family alkylhydroperoxidase